jgi:hypothetical protein
VSFYAHPRLLSGLVEWASANDHVSANQAASDLRHWAGLSPRDNAKAWQAWWKKAKPAVESRYDLGSAAGRKKWYRAYREGSSETRRILLRLWAFEALDEAALLGETAGADAEAAKAVLAELWKQRRLSGRTKGVLVERFLSIRLEEVPDQPVTRARELRIIGTKRFPFPREAWVESGVSFAIGSDPEPALGGSYSSFSLGEGTKPQVLGTHGGGSYPGSPQARAVLELREVDHARDRQVVWKRQWKLGPVRLRKAE